ncbi:MAG: hypothetical protein KAS23_06385, partial [Anaerohalosphaera sp.]|nr:hypothetical protein [Anaerohalosphaera sp.]
QFYPKKVKLPILTKCVFSLKTHFAPKHVPPYKPVHGHPKSHLIKATQQRFPARMDHPKSSSEPTIVAAQ